MLYWDPEVFRVSVKVARSTCCVRPVEALFLIYNMKLSVFLVLLSCNVSGIDWK